MPITDHTPPPVKGTGTRTTARTPKATAPVVTITDKRTQALTDLGGFAQVPLIALKMHADAGTVSLHWPKVAKEIALLADDFEQVARLVDPLMKVGPYAGLIAAALPFLLQVGVNHNRVPAGAMGTVPASTLAAQIETALAYAELDALRTQLEAEKSARAIREEIAESRRAMQEEMASA